MDGVVLRVIAKLASGLDPFPRSIMEPATCRMFGKWIHGQGEGLALLEATIRRVLCRGAALRHHGAACGGGGGEPAPGVVVKRAPQVTSAPVTTASVGVPYVYEAKASDAEGDAWSLTQAPAGMSIDAASGLVTWTPAATQAGNQAVVLRVVDPAGLAATQSFSIAVTAANAAPRITNTPPATAVVGAEALLEPGRGIDARRVGAERALDVAIADDAEDDDGVDVLAADEEVRGLRDRVALGVGHEADARHREVAAHHEGRERAGDDVHRVIYTLMRIDRKYAEIRINSVYTGKRMTGGRPLPPDRDTRSGVSSLAERNLAR